MTNTTDAQELPQEKRRRPKRRRQRRSRSSSYIGAGIVLLLIVLLGYWWVTVNEFSSLNDVFDWFRGVSTEVRDSEVLENNVVMGEGNG